MAIPSPEQVSVPQPKEEAKQSFDKPKMQISERAKKWWSKVTTKIKSLRKPENPDEALKVIAETPVESESSLITKYPEGMDVKDLRDPKKVGPQEYNTDSVSGSDKKIGLVNKHQAGAKGIEEQEKAQAQAYTEVDKKMETGLVRPDFIGAEMVERLGVSSELGDIPPRYEDITASVARELDTLVQRESREVSASGEEGLITKTERDLIIAETQEFAALYGKAYGTENVARAFEVARDNARKLAYQVLRDKEVFSGSDHGTRHILEGNLKFAKQMIEDLRKNGVNVSTLDEVAIHQVIIDHDLGYTVGAAQAPRGFEASKDHPLFSAKFIESNSQYYIDKFGEKGYLVIKESVLNHSYPRLEYVSDSSETIHPELIRSITSTVDSLGVTVETKTPAFFWNPDAMRTLLKIKLAMETSQGGKVDPKLMEEYKEELQEVASREPMPQRREGYVNAITHFFNEVTADTTLGHFAGVVRRVSVEKVPQKQAGEHSHDKLRVVVQMTPSEVFALLGDMFGDKHAIKSFAKAM